MKRAIIISLFAASLGACGGNYSNEDLDFQLALPEREDIAVKLPQTAEVSDPAENYLITRKTVKELNGSADVFLSLIDGVRGYPPSERQPGRRIWGPFPVERHPLWLVRVVVDRVGDPGMPTRFEYSLEVRPRLAGADAPWIPLIVGDFAPTGGVRKGSGLFRLTATAARAAGYPLEGLAEIEHLEIRYSTAQFPLWVKISVVNFPSGEKASYEYFEEQDGTGAMRFAFSAPPLWAIVGVNSLEIHSRWKGSGAGRADVTVLTGFASGMKGVECWGIDTRRTFRHVDWDNKNMQDEGVESNCVFGPPAP